jgi:hypothetical protein
MVDPDKKSDDKVTYEVSNASPSTRVEPIVTRWELWSYYRERHKLSVITTVSNGSFSVYYNGGSVRPFYSLLNLGRVLMNS